MAQTLSTTHKIGIHHVATSRNGLVAATAGFDGSCCIYTFSPSDSAWSLSGTITNENKPGEIWAIALSADGQFVVATTYDGRINVWDVQSEGMKKVREYETKGSFGCSIDVSRDGKYTASGHENGGLYVFDNDTGRMSYSLPGKTLIGKKSGNVGS